LGDTWSQIGEIVGLAVQVIQAVVVPVFTAIASFLKTHSDDISTYIGGTWTIISGIIGGALDIIVGVLKVAMALLQGDWEGAWKVIEDTATRVWGHIQGIIDGALTVIASVFGTNLEGLKKIFSDKFEAIKTYLRNIDLAEIGRGIIAGLWTGITERWDTLVADFNKLAGGLSSGAKKIFGIDSPSRVFAEIGRDITQGLAQGIGVSFPTVGQSLTQGITRSIEAARAGVNAASQGLALSAMSGLGAGLRLAPAGATDAARMAAAQVISGGGGRGGMARAGSSTTTLSSRPVFVAGDSYQMLVTDSMTASLTAGLVNERKAARMRAFMGG
jgi:phage-related protein